MGRPRDLDAYDQLVREHQGIAFRTAYVITGSAADAEEVVQDAFVKAYRARGRFRSGRAVPAVAAGDRRQRGAQPPARDGAARAAELQLAEERPSGGAAPSPEVALLAREERAELLAAVDRLGEEQRAAVACRYFLGLSEAETAAVLGCRPGTVKSRLSRALARLEEEL